MKIETKLNVGDKVFILFDNKVHEVEIKSIDIDVSYNTYMSEEVNINYWIKSNPAGRRYTCHFGEHEIFATKEQLLATL